MRGSGRFRRGLVLGVSVVVFSSVAAVVVAESGSGAAAVPALDHFTCYTATAKSTPASPHPFSHTPAKVLLKNRFSFTGFAVAPGAVSMHCNPVQQTMTAAGHSVTTPVRHASAHLLCRSVHATGLTLPASLKLHNQFGTGVLRPTAVRSLCLPSWTTQTTPLKFPPTNAPSGLDSFACYSVVHPPATASFAVPSNVKLKDQFGVVSSHVGAATRLCLPTSKPAGAGVMAPALATPDSFSVCFAIAPAAKVTTRTVYDRNQFGIGGVALKRNSELCLPSTKVVVPPVTTTTTTIPPTTTSTIPVGTPIAVDGYTEPGVKAPFDITTGPDGALWFTNGDNDSIGRITTAGVITNFTDPSMARPDGIASGPDGALWFTNAANDSIGRITTAGVVTHFTHASIKGPFDIVAGSDGALWFTNYDNNTIGRITTAGVVTNYNSAGAPNGHGISFPDGIAAGPDGALWFANTGYGTIGRITTAGVVSNFTDPSIASPYRIAPGPDGAMWFSNGGNNSIGRITTAGVVTNYPDPSISSPQGLVAASDGAMWFMNFGNNTLGRITTAGVVTAYNNPPKISAPYSIAVGPDSALWFTNSGNNSIGRVVVP